MTASSRDDGARPECGFDPVCGSRLPAFYRANPYDDGRRTFYFCSEACRSYFLRHREIQKAPEKRSSCLDRSESSSRPT